MWDVDIFTLDRNIQHLTQLDGHIFRGSVQILGTLWISNEFLRGKSLDILINVDLGKNINCRFLQFRKRKSQSTAKMTMCQSIEVIVYQIQAHC